MNEGSAAFLLVRVGVADARVAALRVAAGHALHRLGFAAVVAFVVALPALPAFLAVPLLLLFHGASSMSLMGVAPNHVQAVRPHRRTSHLPGGASAAPAA